MRALDDLRLFDSLVTTRHYGRTSAECHVSPSTLSRTISRMEAELGVRLLDRDRRSVAPTPEGLRFHRFVEDVLAAWDGYVADRDGDAVTGALSLFCTVTASQTILPDVLARFRRLHPAVHLTLETGYAAEALERLDRGDVDITVAPLPPRVPRSLVTRTIATTPLVLVAPEESHVAVPSEPSAAWGQVPFVLPSSGLARALLDRWFRRHRIRPTVAAEAAGHEAVLSLVSLGCGIGIVPELVAAQSPLAGRLRVVPVAEPLPSFEIAVCTTPERFDRRPVDAFWRSLDG